MVDKKMAIGSCIGMGCGQYIGAAATLRSCGVVRAESVDSAVL